MRVAAELWSGMLEGKVLIVAGGGRGIGEETAVQLGDLGATVVVNDLGTGHGGEGKSDDPARETARRIREAGGEATAHFGDIASFDYTERLVEETVEEYGRVNGAVNFAGVLRDSILYKMDPEEWDAVIRVHLRGHFALLRNLAAHWRELVAEREADRLESQRSFLAVSSTAAFGNVGQANYSTAKAGILGLVRTAAIELHRLNVRVNTLMPLAMTRMYDDVPEERMPFDPDEMPPEKVPPLVGYLMSDEAEDVTGNTFRAKGDAISHVSLPEEHRIVYQEDGWTAEDIADRIHDTLGHKNSLTNLEGAED
jgi:NAD(P)-dependent dehydrogenase (short-subunit alcohol dehydrogenase family)